MSVRFNLLPHREAARKLKKREFNIVLLGLFVGFIALWYFGKLYLDHKIESQQRRNALLIAENKILDQSIERIKQLKEQTAMMSARKGLVEALQQNRSSVVKVMDDIARDLPEGVHLKSIKQNNAQLNLMGHAYSNLQVANLMRKLDASPVFMNAQLIEAKSVNDKSQRMSEFTLSTTIKDLAPKPTVNAPNNSSAASKTPPKP